MEGFEMHLPISPVFPFPVSHRTGPPEGPFPFRVELVGYESGAAVPGLSSY